MGDFAGLWRPDGGRIDAADIERLSHGMGGRGAGSARVWRQGAFAFVCVPHCFSPHDQSDRQPLAAPSGAAIAADSRLAGRADLAERLGLRPDLPDSELILAACERWGDEDAATRLYGDYAYALWRPDRRRLTLVRDPSGFRNLFVCRQRGVVAFSTRLRALLALPFVPTDLDDQALADRLIMNQGPAERTVYTHIRRLPMGHIAILGERDDDFSPRRWWDVPIPEPGFGGTDAQVEEQARAVLDQAVADCLPAIGPVSACLTSGLDSSSVVWSAHRQAPPNGLIALTRVPGPIRAADGNGQCHDETPAAAAFAARLPGLHWRAVHTDNGDWGEWNQRRWFLESGLPGRSFVDMAWFFPLYREMERLNSRVLCGGEQGNGFYSQTGLSLLPTLSRTLRWRRLWGHLLPLSRHSGISLCALMKSTLAPFEPLRLRMRRKGWADVPWGHHAAVNPDFARELDLDKHLDRSVYRMRIGGGHSDIRLSRRWLLQDEDARDIRSTMRAMMGVESRYPLADRRLIEFFGRLPLEQFLRGGVTRSLPRRLLAQTAPETVANNRGLQCGDWHATMTARKGEMTAQLERLRSSPLARRIVDLNRLEHLLATWPTDADQAEPNRRAYQRMLSRGLEMGEFLAWRDGSNA